MKICYIANARSVHTQKWAKYFAGKGHQVHLISPKAPSGDNLQNIQLHPIRVLEGIRGVSLLTLPSTVNQIRQIVRNILPDILHAHFVSGYGFWGTLCGFHPFVVTAWGSDILLVPENSKLSKSMVRFTLKRADLITCDAEHLAQRMVELGAPRDRICLIYFGVDTQKFNPEHRDPQFKVAQFGSDSPAVISLRNLSPIYDVESLVKAVPLVLAHIPDAKFIIGGDGEQRKYLENLASSLGVLSSIKFVGQLPSDQLPFYLASVDVYVSTSLSDGGLSSSTAEAMACGLPVVITDFGNNRDWIRDGENGFNVPLQDPPALACKLVYLLRHDTFRRRFGEINRAVIEERNNYQKEMHKMEKLYIELIQKCRY